MVVTRWIVTGSWGWWYSYAYSEKNVETVRNSHFRYSVPYVQEST